MTPGGSALRVVLDTNVLFSALAFPAESPPAQVFRLLLDGKLHASCSPFILHELEQALEAKAGWEAEQLQRLRRRLKPAFTWLVPTSHISVITRLDADNRILECAVDAHADALITGNMKDLRPLGVFQGVAILTPREFLAKYFPKQ